MVKLNPMVENIQKTISPILIALDSETGIKI